MRSRIINLMFAVFLIGLGSAIFFFEISEYTFEDGSEISFPQSSTTITDNYPVVGIDKIWINGAEVIIDEAQEGIKVEITFNKDIIDLQSRTYTYITDCTTERSSECDSTDKDKITTLELSYDRVGSGFNFRDQVEFMIDQAKEKKIIVNIFALIVPTIKVTVNSETYKMIIR
jgi:hypothetical protein